MTTDAKEKPITIHDELAGLMKAGPILKAHFEYLKAVGKLEPEAEETLARIRKTIKRLQDIRDKESGKVKR